MAPVNTVEKQDSRFQKGRSGNPNGRPKGSRNAATLAAEAMLEGEAVALTRKAIEMALGGDTVALRICMERLLPIRKDRAVSFELPPITGARDAADISAAVVAAVSNGAITLSEGAEVGKLIDSYVRSHRAAELDDRMALVKQMTDAELMRVIMKAEMAAAGPAQQDQKLLVLNGDEERASD